MWNVDWGKIVKDARMDYGMTQEELSWGICNVSTLSRIETGHTDPSLQNIEAIFNKLELSDSMVELLAYVCGGRSCEAKSTCPSGADLWEDPESGRDPDGT